MAISVINIIKDGSFEKENPPTGDFSKIGSPVVEQDVGEPDNYGGQYSVKITSGGAGNEGIQATLSNLKPSTLYTVRVRAKASSGDTAKIWTTGASTNLSETTTSVTFVDLIGHFITDSTPTDVVLKLGSDNNGDVVWFDKLIVIEGEGAFEFSPHPEDFAQDNDKIQDADGDTAVETEKNAGENKVRIKTEGTERAIIDSTGHDFKQHQAKQLVIENRTSDPGSPVAGQIWFRTDV